MRLHKPSGGIFWAQGRRLPRCRHNMKEVPAVVPERLDKLLSATGCWSRKEIKDLVRQGRVLVDQVPARKPEEKFDPKSVTILVDGEPADCAPFVYVMMHKPEGLLSATEDTRQKTVLDLLPQYLRRRGLFPVGRLDKDTTGLLLLTDDGPLAHELLSPKKHVDKVYLAEVEGKVDDADITALAKGMVLGDGLQCLPAGLEPVGDGCTCLVTLHEGKYHQVKRMLAARGKPVLALKRLSMGPLSLDEGLTAGEWRMLTEGEVATLKRAIGRIEAL